MNTFSRSLLSIPNSKGWEIYWGRVLSFLLFFLCSSHVFCEPSHFPIKEPISFQDIPIDLSPASQLAHIVHKAKEVKLDYPPQLEKLITPSLTRISHQTLGKLGTSAFPNIPSNSFGNVFKHSLQELLEISKKQAVQSSSRAYEKCGLIWKNCLSHSFPPFSLSKVPLLLSTTSNKRDHLSLSFFRSLLQPISLQRGGVFLQVQRGQLFPSHEKGFLRDLLPMSSLYLERVTISGALTRPKDLVLSSFDSLALIPYKVGKRALSCMNFAPSWEDFPIPFKASFLSLCTPLERHFSPSHEEGSLRDLLPMSSLYLERVTISGALTRPKDLVLSSFGSLALIPYKVGKRALSCMSFAPSWGDFPVSFKASFFSLHTPLERHFSPSHEKGSLRDLLPMSSLYLEVNPISKALTQAIFVSFDPLVMTPYKVDKIATFGTSFTPSWESFPISFKGSFLSVDAHIQKRFFSPSQEKKILRDLPLSSSACLEHIAISKALIRPKERLFNFFDGLIALSYKRQKTLSIYAASCLSLRDFPSLFSPLYVNRSPDVLVPQNEGKCTLDTPLMWTSLALNTGLTSQKTVCTPFRKDEEKYELGILSTSFFFKRKRWTFVPSMRKNYTIGVATRTYSQEFIVNPLPPSLEPNRSLILSTVLSGSTSFKSLNTAHHPDYVSLDSLLTRISLRKREKYRVEKSDIPLSWTPYLSFLCMTDTRGSTLKAKRWIPQIEISSLAFKLANTFATKWRVDKLIPFSLKWDVFPLYPLKRAALKHMRTEYAPSSLQSKPLSLCAFAEESPRKRAIFSPSQEETGAASPLLYPHFSISTYVAKKTLPSLDCTYISPLLFSIDQKFSKKDLQTKCPIYALKEGERLSTHRDVAIDVNGFVYFPKREKTSIDAFFPMPKVAGCPLSTFACIKPTLSLHLVNFTPFNQPLPFSPSFIHKKKDPLLLGEKYGQALNRACFLFAYSYSPHAENTSIVATLYPHTNKTLLQELSSARIRASRLPIMLSSNFALDDGEISKGLLGQKWLSKPFLFSSLFDNAIPTLSLPQRVKREYLQAFLCVEEMRHPEAPHHFEYSYKSLKEQALLAMAAKKRRLLPTSTHAFDLSVLSFPAKERNKGHISLACIDSQLFGVLAFSTQVDEATLTYVEKKSSFSPLYEIPLLSPSPSAPSLPTLRAFNAKGASSFSISFARVAALGCLIERVFPKGKHCTFSEREGDLNVRVYRVASLDNKHISKGNLIHSYRPKSEKIHLSLFLSENYLSDIPRSIFAFEEGLPTLYSVDRLFPKRSLAFSPSSIRKQRINFFPYSEWNSPLLARFCFPDKEGAVMPTSLLTHPEQLSIRSLCATEDISVEVSKLSISLVKGWPLRSGTSFIALFESKRSRRCYSPSFSLDQVLPEISLPVELARIEKREILCAPEIRFRAGLSDRLKKPSQALNQQAMLAVEHAPLRQIQPVELMFISTAFTHSPVLFHQLDKEDKSFLIPICGASQLLNALASFHLHPKWLAAIESRFSLVKPDQEIVEMMSELAISEEDLKDPQADRVTSFAGDILGRYQEKYCIAARKIYLPQTPLRRGNQGKLAKRANRMLRSTEDYLNSLPTVDDLNTLSFDNAFETALRYTKRKDGKGYFFALEIKPNKDLSFPSPEQNFIFLIDGSGTIKKERYQAFKKGVSKALHYLREGDSFNIVIADSSIKEMNPRPLSWDKKSIHYGRRYLQSREYRGFFAKSNTFSLLEVAKKYVVPDKHNVVILLTDGHSLGTIKAHAKDFNNLAKRSQNTFSLFTAAASQHNNLSMLDLVSTFNGGELMYSKTNAAFPRKLAILVKNIENFVASNIHIQATSYFADVDFYPNLKALPTLYGNRSYTVYGTIDELRDFKVLLQGRTGKSWMNIKQSISFQNAKQGGSSLERNFAQQQAYVCYHYYLDQKDPFFLAEAERILKSHAIPCAAR